ncbi:MAG TPA: hypothetical protein VIU61_09510 [Kofleriaceae bacterium]
MLAAALIPLIFIIAILVMFVLGAWPIGPLASVGIISLLVWFGYSLMQFLNMDEQSSHR